MKTIETNAYLVALRHIGTKEMQGPKTHPYIAWCISTCSTVEPYSDETPWCSAFLNGICYELGLNRSGSLAARSWLKIGIPITLDEAVRGLDIVIFKRGKDPQPGPEVLKAPGHVALFSAIKGNMVEVLGGNQGDAVNIAEYPITDILGIRRLAA